MVGPPLEIRWSAIQQLNSGQDSYFSPSGFQADNNANFLRQSFRLELVRGFRLCFKHGVSPTSCAFTDFEPAISSGEE
jgi:hypothetical protein